MDERHEQLREAVTATRSHLRVLQRVARSALQLVTDLEERLADLEDNPGAQPQEAQRDHHRNGRADKPAPARR